MSVENEKIDLFLSCGELSGDCHGALLVDALLKKRPLLKIGAVAGPNMRKRKILCFFPMEKLSIMGFIDVLLSFASLIKMFFSIRKKILSLNPKAVVLIDYPGFHLQLAKSLKKKGFKGKIIQYICPTVWAWRKKRIFLMEKVLDKVLTIFPFEPAYFSLSTLPAFYVGHPLSPIAKIPQSPLASAKKILALFPGSRKKEIRKNFPLQLAVAQRLKTLDPSLTIVVSDAIGALPSSKIPFTREKNKDSLMRSAHLALATSGTVTLELALHKVPTIVHFAISRIDLWIAQKIFHIDLPFYCIVNIILKREVFPEFFGPHFTEKNLFSSAKTLWFDEEMRIKCQKRCLELSSFLGEEPAAENCSSHILDTLS